MANYLVTGCSRGLGLELVRQLASSQSVGTIFATARRQTAELEQVVKQSGGKVIFVELDITRTESVKAAAVRVRSVVGHLDVLVNNAGMINWQTEPIEQMDDLMQQLSVNVGGAQNVTAAMVPLLLKGSSKKIINISTSVGSISWAGKYSIMNVPAYKVSKAALNMLTVQWSEAHKAEGLIVFAVSPGWLRTDLGTAAADLSVEQGAKAVLEIVKKSGTDWTGKFYNIRVDGWEKNEGLNQYDGAELPW